MSQIYYDAEGNEISLYKLVRQEPDWAMSRVQVSREQAEEIEKLKQRIAELKAAKVGAGKKATVTREMIGAAHDVMLAKGDFVLSANLLERIYLAMEQAAPPPQTPFDTCPTCEALARTVMMDQTGAA
jgi:hypothetical protein